MENFPSTRVDYNNSYNEQNEEILDRGCLLPSVLFAIIRPSLIDLFGTN